MNIKTVICEIALSLIRIEGTFYFEDESLKSTADMKQSILFAVILVLIGLYGSSVAACSSG